MNASIPVLKKIRDALPQEEGMNVLIKYGRRYKKDSRLQEIIKSRRDADPAMLREKIMELIKVREIEAHGGQGLALKDRRRFQDD